VGSSAFTRSEIAIVFPFFDEVLEDRSDGEMVVRRIAARRSRWKGRRGADVADEVLDMRVWDFVGVEAVDDGGLLLRRRRMDFLGRFEREEKIAMSCFEGTDEARRAERRVRVGR
jgi:hypothetical protein